MTHSTLAPESLPQWIDRARAQAEFSDVYGNRFDHRAVKHLYDTNQHCVLSSADAIHIPRPELQGLASELGGSLGVYKSPSSGSIGNGLYLLKGSSASPRLPSVDDYAKMLVLAASRIGTERVAELFSGWLRGESIRLHRCALLKGIKTAGKFRPVQGMRLETLPTNANDFPPSLRIDMGELRHEQFGGRAMLAIEYETDRALYDPETFRESFPPEPPRRDLVNPELASVTAEAFCRSMSLAADNHVDWFIQWEDYGDIEAFFLGAGFSSGRKEATNTPAVLVSEDDVRLCLAIHADLNAFSKLDLAIARWRRSKRSTAAHEQLVELRIALESVLLSADPASLARNGTA